jgi:hypothetical protein
MVASEPNELLLLYIMATAEVVSMVLVAERQEPKKPQALKGAPVTGSGSQDQTLQKGHVIKRLSGPSSQSPP